MKKAASVSALAIVLAATGAMQGAVAKTTCTRGSDARIIEVVAPGVVGQSCDVRYTRAGGDNVSVPYHADNAGSFCNQKADEMIKRLALSGFACVQSAPRLRADASPSSDYVVEARRAEPAPQAAAQTPAPAAASVEQPAPVAVAQAEPAAPVPAPAAASPVAANAIAPAQNHTAALEDEMSKILAQPAAETVPGEPAQLVAQQAAPPSRPQATPVGRLVGADADAPRPATAVTQASLQEPVEEEAPKPVIQPAPEPVVEPEPAAPAAAPVVQPEKAAAPKAAASDLREPADVIRATLMAQAAAWNEGDLDGFMNSYWKSDDLKFVSGVTVTKGWNATMKRYRDRYSGGDGLGRLGFDKLEIKLVTNDVAIVTGRFNLVRGAETSNGTFSLVMRRDAGAWRIVHDHTSADPAP